MEYPFQSHFVQTKEINIHYLKEGSGDPVILLHGWPQTAYCWRKQIEHLSKHYTVYAPDNRGFGLTDKPRIRITRDMLARDVINFMDALDIPNATIIGHDWGGIIGFKVAVDYPDRVDRLSLIDTSTTVWPTWAGHAYWAKLADKPEEFFNRCSEPFLKWCLKGEKVTYEEGVIAPFPSDPLPGAKYDWCDEQALAHYVSAFEDAGTQFASVAYYNSGLPMHRMLLSEDDNLANTTFDYIGEQGCRDIWGYPKGFYMHPDVVQPLCFAPEDFHKTFDKQALFVYSPLLIPGAFEEGLPIEGYQLGGDLWQDSISKAFPRLDTAAISCGHFIPEEAPEALNSVLSEFLLSNN